jgi:hypothetical protein
LKPFWIAALRAAFSSSLTFGILNAAMTSLKACVSPSMRSSRLAERLSACSRTCETSPSWAS